MQGMKEKLGGYSFYKAIGSPVKIVAPMVDASELAFRMMCRKYGADLCYTPMLHSRLFVEMSSYRKKKFEVNKLDRPLIVQFCGNDAEMVVKAAKMVEKDCDGIDLNLGCPQNIARKGKYGAFLLEDTERVCSIVKKMHEEICVPICCKIRLLPRLEDTIHLCHKLVEAGCQMLVVHGRTKEMNKQRCKEADWESIKVIKGLLNIPVIANGGMANMDEAMECLENTSVDGVMTSEGILENPAFFTHTKCPETGRELSQIELAQEYLEFVGKYPPLEMKIARGHLFKFLHAELKVHTDLRIEIARSKEYKDTCDVVQKLADRLEIQPMTRRRETIWYYRHRENAKANAEAQSKAILEVNAVHAKTEDVPTLTTSIP